MKGRLKMKSIKDLSIQVGVSKTSVYNLIKKNNIETFKKDGKTLIDQNGENLIIAYYSTDQQKTLEDIITDSKQQLDDNFQPNFQDDFQPNKQIENTDLIRILENQLTEKDKTIQALINVISYEKNYQTARLLADNNKNMMNVQSEPISPSSTKKSFFERLFKR